MKQLRSQSLTLDHDIATMQTAAALKHRRFQRRSLASQVSVTLLESGDSDQDIESSDLGLGDGLKPGGLPRLPEPKPEPEIKPESPTLDEQLCGKHSKRKWYSYLKRTEHKNGNLRRLSRQRTRSVKSSASSLDEADESDVSQILCPAFLEYLRASEEETSQSEAEVFPAYHDVIMGTSIRQQKILFERDANEILNRSPLQSLHEVVNQPVHDAINCWRCYEEQNLDERLRRAEQEVCLLRDELERSQKQLDTKYKAIQIMQKQSQVTQYEHDATNRKVLNMTKAMEQEINKLQFELEYRQSSLMDSQQTWAERFDHVCQENTTLVTALEERTEELRRIKSDKMAVMRERDELLALLDVKERMKYEQSHGQTESDAYSEFTSNELAVLGACNCRGTCGDPCSCAYMAANLRRELIKLKDMLEIRKRRLQEANTTADAYRMAFEEQLYRNKALASKVAELTSPLLAKKNKSPLAVMKWLVKQLKDDIPPKITPSPGTSPRAAKPKAKTSPTKQEDTKDHAPTHDTDPDESAPESAPNPDDQQSPDSPVKDERANDEQPENGLDEKPQTSDESHEQSTIPEHEDKDENHDNETEPDSSEHEPEPAPSTSGVSANMTSQSDIATSATKSGDESPSLDKNDWDVVRDVEANYSTADIMAIENEQQLIAYLLERLGEQNELLAHQRLAAMMLANRTAELERRLSMHGDDLSEDL